MKLSKISVFLLAAIFFIVGRGVLVSVKNYTHPQDGVVITVLGTGTNRQHGNDDFRYHQLPQAYSDLFEEINPYNEMTEYPVYRRASRISTDASYSYMSGMDSISRRVVHSQTPIQLFSSTSVMLPYCATSIETAAADISLQSVNVSSSSPGRRNFPENPGDPFLDPVGDMPWGLMLLLLAGYVWYRRR